MSTGGEGFYEKMRGERWREEKPRANRDESAAYDGEQQKRRGERCSREKVFCHPSAPLYCQKMDFLTIH